MAPSHAAQPGTVWWLQAEPLRNVVNPLSDRDFILAAGLKLRLSLVPEDHCPCGAMIDTRGVHRLNCRTLASGRLARHYAINDLVSRALRGIPNSREPRSLSPNDQLRPDGLTHELWSRGQRSIWDFSIRDAYAACYWSISRNAKAVVQRGELDKRTKYESLLGEYCLLPLIVQGARLLETMNKPVNLLSEYSEILIMNGM